MEEVMLVTIGVLSRLLPHPANFTAVGGLALFSGAKFDTKKAVILTLLTMFLSDAVIGFHSLMWATYGSFFIATLIGKWIGRHARLLRLFGGVLASSVVFFVITNFAVWSTTLLYPKTLNGFITCYVMAIPFFRNSIIGDVFYTTTLFIVYDYVQMLSIKFEKVCAVCQKIR